MITIKNLTLLKPILNISAICKLTELNNNTILGKIEHNRELTVTESDKIEKLLNQHGLFFGEPK